LRLGELIRAGFPVPGGFVVTQQVLSLPELGALERKRIERAWRRIGAERVAVRSSGLNEDGADMSYAGVFESKLNVDWGGFFAALEEVKQSLSSQRVSAYSGHAESGGIVVQKMVAAEYAGVVFTEHPGNSGSLLVELVAGLGDALVSGQATPDSFQFGRYSGQPLFAGASPIDLQPLLALARRVEKHFGRPQDIEWAYAGGAFHLLQTRDITSDSRTGRSQKAVFERERFRLLQLFGGQPADQVVLKQTELTELLPSPTPLSLTLMDRLWGPGGSVDLACSEIGIPYEVAERSPPYVLSAFGALYVNMVEQGQRLGKGPGLLAAFRLSRAAEAIERQFQEEFLPGYLREVRMREAVDFRRLSVAELVALFAAWTDRFVTETYVQASVVNIAAEYFMNIAKRELEKHGESPVSYLAHAPRTVVHQAMSLLPAIREKQRSIQEFLELFGHRAPQDFELAQPRYREDLDLVVKMAERAGLFGENEDQALPLPEHSVLQLAVNRARRLQTLKEEAKHHCLRDLAVLRQIVLELDRQLDLGGHIFYLELEQVLRLADASFMNEAFNLALLRRQEAVKLEAPRRWSSPWPSSKPSAWNWSWPAARREIPPPCAASASPAPGKGSAGYGYSPPQRRSTCSRRARCWWRASPIPPGPRYSPWPPGWSPRWGAGSATPPSWPANSGSPAS
jgi:rifampicin phosphotransferase